MDCIHIIMVVAIVLSIWGPKRFIILSFILSFVAGFLMGAGGKNGSLLLGLFIGISFSILFTGTGIITRYYRDRAIEQLKTRDFESLYPSIKLIQKRGEETKDD